MAYPDVTLKIHHIDGDMTAPWEYYDTLMQCEVDTPMVMVNGAAATYKLAVTMTRSGDNPVSIKDLWISMGEYADGLSFEELASGDEGTVAAAFSKTKPMPMVYIRNDMVLESVSYKHSLAPGDRAVMDTTNETPVSFLWADKANDPSDKLPTFLVIDAQPMVEGQDLPQKLLLRYIG